MSRLKRVSEKGFTILELSPQSIALSRMNDERSADFFKDVFLQMGKVHENNVAKSLDYKPGSMICMDRGYTDYDWWEELT